MKLGFSINESNVPAELTFILPRSNSLLHILHISLVRRILSSPFVSFGAKISILILSYLSIIAEIFSGKISYSPSILLILPAALKSKLSASSNSNAKSPSISEMEKNWSAATIRISLSLGSTVEKELIFSRTSLTLSLTCASALEAKRSLTTRLCLKLPSGAISAPLSHSSESLSVNFSGKMQRIAEASTLSKTVQSENAPIFAATAKNDIERVKLSPIARLENEVKRLHKSDENAYAPIKKSAFSFVIPSAKPRHSDTINAKR